PGIGLKLGAAFSCLVVLLLACVGFGVMRLESLKESMHSLLEREVRAGVQAAHLDGAAQGMAKALGQAVLSDSVDDVQKQLQIFENLRNENAVTREALEAAVDSAASRAVLKEVADAEPAYMAAIDKVVAAIKGGDTDAARLQLNDKGLREASTAYLNALMR